MSDEVKLNDCKLCGGVDIEPTCYDDMDLHGGSAIYCVECGFSMDSIDSWNDLKVPIIATKDERIAELEQQLAEAKEIIYNIADSIIEQGMEDESSIMDNKPKDKDND